MKCFSCGKESGGDSTITLSRIDGVVIYRPSGSIGVRQVFYCRECFEANAPEDLYNFLWKEEIKKGEGPPEITFNNPNTGFYYSSGSIVPTITQGESFPINGSYQNIIDYLYKEFQSQVRIPDGTVDPNWRSKK